MFALIDCNNFYASCERLFRPDLRDKPVLVLSNNDGCVIARSNEVRALGIAMGEPYFKVKALCKQAKVTVFSSNYCLYGDLSQRVMSTIEQAWPHIEIYSIDEAFLDLSSLPARLRESFCLSLQKKILKDIGIPTSIGIGPTKTLAKIANHVCKKRLKIPVLDVSLQREYWLKQIAVEEVWGIGRQWSKQLRDRGIQTAYDLSKANAHSLKKQFNVVMMRTAMELQGIACHALEELSAKKSILSSRSFGQMQTELAAIAQALSRHCTLAVEKLRQQQSLAQRIHVFIYTNRHREDLAQHMQSIEVRLINPTDDLRIITAFAKKALEQLFKPGYYYKKTGLCLEELMPKTPCQLDLFHQPTENDLEKNQRFMSIMDNINKKFGSHTIGLAAEACPRKSSLMRAQLKSPAYTTRWTDLAHARVK